MKYFMLQCPCCTYKQEEEAKEQSIELYCTCGITVLMRPFGEKYQLTYSVNSKQKQTLEVLNELETLRND